MYGGAAGLGARRFNRRPAGIGGVRTPGHNQWFGSSGRPIGAAMRMWSAVANKMLQRNVINVFTTWVDFGEITRIHNEADFSATPASHFEAILRTFDAAVPVRGRLFNITDNNVVSGSQVATISTVALRVRSPAMSIPAGEKLYKAQFGA